MSLEVVSVAGLATVQDRGRPGHMHDGVPPGGALVPELLARANAAAGNEYGEAAVELVGAMVLLASDRLTVATCDGDTRALRPGERWEVPPIGRTGSQVRYLAVRGGVDVPTVLDGRGTLLVAGLGGHEGRPLRKGDRLRPAHRAPLALPMPAPPDLEAPVVVCPGPDLDCFPSSSLDALLAGPLSVHLCRDRVGQRLAGRRLARADDDAGVSSPMVRGAIQVPASGEPIVLGPDHPTTGGYPVLATVVRASLGSLAARPVGALVRFSLAPVLDSGR